MFPDTSMSPFVAWSLVGNSPRGCRVQGFYHPSQELKFQQRVNDSWPLILRHDSLPQKFFPSAMHQTDFNATRNKEFHSPIGPLALLTVKL